MRLLLDTNVLLDVLLDRQPFAPASAQVLTLVETGRVHGFVCATSVTTVFYLSQKMSSRAAARKHVNLLLSLLEVAAVNRPVLESAASSKIRDYEDAVVDAAALAVGADFIVTRDRTDFKSSQVPATSPEDLLGMLKAQDGGSA